MTNLRRLEYFLAVARERNFTRAAERLHIAQPALSRQVRELERELGTELIHRTTHDFELTEAGTLLLARGPQLIASADELWRSVRAHGSGEVGDVVVAYGASASYETAPRLLEALARDQPGIAIGTEVRAAAEIVAGVQDGSVDLGLVRCPPDEPGLERRDGARRPPGPAHAPRPPARRDAAGPSDPRVGGTAADRTRATRTPGTTTPCSRSAASRAWSPTWSSGASSSTSARRRSCTATPWPSWGSRPAPGCPPSSRGDLSRPPGASGIDLVARRHDRSPVVVRPPDAADRIAGELGWV